MYAEQVEDLEEYNLRKSSCLHFMGVNTIMFCLWVQLGDEQMKLYLSILGILTIFFTSDKVQNSPITNFGATHSVYVFTSRNSIPRHKFKPAYISFIYRKFTSKISTFQTPKHFKSR